MESDQGKALRKRRVALVIVGGVGVVLLAGVIGWQKGWFDEVKKQGGVGPDGPEVTGEGLAAGDQVHDFGAVRVGTRLRHMFRVRNQTGGQWTVRRIVTSCSCAAATAPERSVKPGEEFELLMQYKAPDEEASDHRKVTVFFQEPGAENLVFEIRATVIRAFSVSTKLITINWTWKDKPTVRTITVSNNTGEAWGGIEVGSGIPWLKTAVRRESPRKREFWCMERWLVEAVIDARMLTSGQHEGDIVIRPAGRRGEGLEAWTVRIAAVVAPAVEVIPRQLFVGEVGRDGRKESSVLLRFSPETCPAEAEAFEVSHDVGRGLKTTMRRVSNSASWLVECKLEGAELTFQDGYVKGIMRIRVKGLDGGELEIPVLGKAAGQ